VRTDRRVALADETRMMEPTQCMGQPELAEPLKDRFEVVETCVEEDHWWRYVLKGCECGQLYFFEFYELVDWEGGTIRNTRRMFPLTVRRRSSG
jgi:hypothetical protein